jgi:hypothetical protein
MYMRIGEGLMSSAFSINPSLFNSQGTSSLPCKAGRGLSFLNLVAWSYTQKDLSIGKAFSDPKWTALTQNQLAG